MNQLKDRLQAQCIYEASNTDANNESQKIMKQPITSDVRPAISYFHNASKDGDTVGRSGDSGIGQSSPSQIENVIKLKPTFGKENISNTKQFDSAYESAFESAFESTNQITDEENSLLNSIETTNGILPSQIENIIKFKPTFAKRKVNTTLFSSKNTTNTQKSTSLKQKSMSMNQNSMSMNQNSTSMNQHSMSMNQNPMSSSESINESISSNESDGNSSWNSSQNSCILPSQIENIIKGRGNLRRYFQVGNVMIPSTFQLYKVYNLLPFDQQCIFFNIQELKSYGE